MEWKDKPITVLKFGGTSVASPERMRHVAGIIDRIRNEGYRVAIVASAMGNTTDDLIAIAESVSMTRDGREMDQLLATGEQQACALLALTLQQFGIPAQSFTAAQAGIYAKGFPMEGRIYKIEPQYVIKALDEGKEIPEEELEDEDDEYKKHVDESEKKTFCCTYWSCSCPGDCIFSTCKET